MTKVIWNDCGCLDICLQNDQEEHDSLMEKLGPETASHELHYARNKSKRDILIMSTFNISFAFASWRYLVVPHPFICEHITCRHTLKKSRFMIQLIDINNNFWTIFDIKNCIQMCEVEDRMVYIPLYLQCINHKDTFVHLIGLINCMQGNSWDVLL